MTGKEKVLKSLAGGFSLKAHEHVVTALFLEPAQTVSLLLSLSLVCFTVRLQQLHALFSSFCFRFNVERKTGSVQTELGRPTCFRACCSHSLSTNAPALPHSSHFRPEASKRQIFVFILSWKTLNAAGPLLGHVCLFIARKKIFTGCFVWKWREEGWRVTQASW